MNKSKYLLSNSRKFHHLEIAKILYENNKLEKLVCGSPYYKLKDKNIPKKFLNTNPIFNIIRELIPNLNFLKIIHDLLNIANVKNIDFQSSKFIENSDIFLSLSKSGLRTGKLIKKLKKIYICERASSHIIFQNNILQDEYADLGLPYKPINKWFIDRELEEYENSNFILVPSKFVEKTFQLQNVYKTKVLNFGSYIDNFFPIQNFKKKADQFNVLFVGGMSIRKGLHYLIEGFKKFKHPNKRLNIIGSETRDKYFFRDLIKKNNNNDIFVHGAKSQKEINIFLNDSNAFILPSLDEGLATVTLQACSSGCPLIISENTGAAEFVSNNNCGFVILKKI